MKSTAAGSILADGIHFPIANARMSVTTAVSILADDIFFPMANARMSLPSNLLFLSSVTLGNRDTILEVSRSNGFSRVEQTIGGAVQKAQLSPTSIHKRRPHRRRRPSTNFFSLLEGAAPFSLQFGRHHFHIIAQLYQLLPCLNHECLKILQEFGAFGIAIPWQLLNGSIRLPVRRPDVDFELEEFPLQGGGALLFSLRRLLPHRQRTRRTLRGGGHVISVTHVTHAHIAPVAKGVPGFAVTSTVLHRDDPDGLHTRHARQVFGLMFGVDTLASLAQEFLTVLAPNLASRFYALFRTSITIQFAGFQLTAPQRFHQKWCQSQIVTGHMFLAMGTQAISSKNHLHTPSAERMKTWQRLRFQVQKLVAFRALECLFFTYIGRHLENFL
ncbi:unnamed protein product [Acanthosepion pharaonis]|uniref:Uncharacterized protein n=1 Tax=Acanthosepion pharaonis TaxID=158019 RepID=A0A812DUI1_ACAPH|nr:unnamed protein product [Sepia pharaonis]